MTDSTKKPTHRALIAAGTFKNAKGEEKTRWLAIGSAWPTEDGKGFSVKLDALPIDGRIVIKPDEPKPANGTEANA